MSIRPDRHGSGFGARVAILALLLVVLARTAWLCDDAYISLRTVDNFLHGYGLRWNVAERVQSFTHPLWLLLVSAAGALTGELFRTTIGLSVVVAMTSAALFLLRLVRMTWFAIVGGLVLVLSPAFVAYCTSGLEVALSYLLFVVFALLYFEPRSELKRTFWMSFVTALALITRLDHAWIYGPPLIYSWLHTGGRDVRVRHLRWALVGAIPLVAWHGFSLVYYGFLVPNSAPAKLMTGLSLFDYMGQGAKYYFDSMLRDPLTSLVIVGGLGVTLRRGHGPQRAVAVGVLLYLAYVFCIGGDFMRGRFLAMPLLATLCMLVRLELPQGLHRKTWQLGVPLLVVALGFAVQRPVLLSGRSLGASEAYPEYKKHFGIADERWVYFQHYGLFNGRPTADKPGARMDVLRSFQAADSTRLKIVWAVGRSGLMGGPKLHLVDAYGLTDPLLARLPMPQGANWRVGHYRRMLPEGYLRSLALDRNEISDPRIREFYARIRSVTRGPLFDRQRWIDIVNLNLRRSDHLVRGNRRYRVVATDEFVSVYEHLAAGAGPTIRWEAARAYMETGNLVGAQQAIGSLVHIPQEYRYGYVAPDYTLETVRFALDHDKRGNTDFAQQLLNFMAVTDPERSEPQAALGAVHLNAGRLDEARRHFEAAARLGDMQARDVLEQLRNVSGD